MILTLVRKFCQKFGYNLVRFNYHSPVPIVEKLKPETWSKISQLIGIDINEKEQLKLLSLFESTYKREYDLFPENRSSIIHQYYLNNNYFMSVDGEILYCMIRYFKPKKIIEIGSGFSTCLSAQAILKNKEEIEDYNCELVSIEPYPKKILRKGFKGLSKLKINHVQDIPLSEFEKLTENDILFIDSTHVLKIGSDVQFEFLEILPRVNKGVIVHIHDIFLPSEYPKEYVLEYEFYWNEQYLLQAFLIFNNCFKILWAASYMHLKHPDKLEKSFSSYNKKSIWPKSFWMKKIN